MTLLVNTNPSYRMSLGKLSRLDDHHDKVQVHEHRSWSPEHGFSGLQILIYFDINILTLVVTMYKIWHITFKLYTRISVCKSLDKLFGRNNQIQLCIPFLVGKGFTPKHLIFVASRSNFWNIFPSFNTIQY